MTNISVDISNEIDGGLKELLRELATFTTLSNTPLLVVGAAARDIVFEMTYGISAGRATMDLDCAVLVPSWSAFEGLATDLIDSNRFIRNRSKPHRFIHSRFGAVDVIPFGPLEAPKGNIRWPSNSSDMTTLGFEEAYDTGVLATIEEGLQVRVASPPALVVTKLFAYEDAFPHRTKDAEDIDFMLRSYEQAGNRERIYGDDRDLTEKTDFDMSMVSPRLLGRDIAAMAQAKTREAILALLDKETDPRGYGRLVRDMMKRKRDFDEEFSEKLRLLEQLKQGILDGKHRTT